MVNKDGTHCSYNKILLSNSTCYECGTTTEVRGDSFKVALDLTANADINKIKDTKESYQTSHNIHHIPISTTNETSVSFFFGCSLPTVNVPRILAL